MPSKTSDAIKSFNAFYSEFRKTSLWFDMLNTHEDSPWHREENVARHTEMLIEWYLENRAVWRAERQQVLSLVSSLMHDIGKPAAEVVKFSEERGEYRAYHGHEQLSARLWADFALSNRTLIKETLRFNIKDISNVSLMVEYHVPFGLKDKVKRKNLKGALLSRLGPAGHQAWLDFIWSDQHGRISDGQAEKLETVSAWMNEWETV